MFLNLVNVIYSQVIRENETRERSLRHYPSSACALIEGKLIGKCRRATWFEWKKFEKTNPMDAPALFKINCGNLIHNFMNEFLNHALFDLGWIKEQYEGDGKGEEVSFVWQHPGLKFPFSGRLDNRFITPEGKRIIVEWKSTYGRGADYIKKDGPKDEHLLQCVIYLEQDIYPTDGVILIYATRDSGYLFGYWITKEREGLRIEHMNSSKITLSSINFKTILEGTKSLEDVLEIETPPLRDYTDKQWNCNYCSYEKICKKFEDID